jgi:hypothetical protein
MTTQQDALRKALEYCKHQTESLRVWNGQGWTYHPPQAKRIFDAAEEALAANPQDTQPVRAEQTAAVELAMAGALLANWAYNAAQNPGQILTKDDCETLTAMRKRWDAARLKYHEESKQ